MITLNPYDSTILFHGQQEDIKYEFVRSGISEDNKIHFVIDESNDIKSFTITWNNQNPELAKWDLTNYYLGDKLHEGLFVSQEHENDFESIKQPCRECWDDEFCDEIESRKGYKMPITRACRQVPRAGLRHRPMTLWLLS